MAVLFQLAVGRTTAGEAMAAIAADGVVAIAAMDCRRWHHHRFWDSYHVQIRERPSHGLRGSHVLDSYVLDMDSNDFDLDSDSYVSDSDSGCSHRSLAIAL
ncbi:hypothetical protein JKP88DRAFT_248820 [Tribonema minus]|uniref:Uncharacterized protein n=1 Tax=Tribonema minus TaxID=303371 RepID=A0A836C974_9STRA|nr:hypothetical protein JKP88DRAFT_248820 [Tribonema minus]